jgi:hypothetical protein
MGDQWWNEKRWQAFQKNNHCCWACGVHITQAWKHQWLEGHECYEYLWEEGRLIHSFIHDGHLAVMCMSGKITRAEENYIRKTGFDILKAHDLLSVRAERHLGISGHAPWDEWVMVVEDQEFKYLGKEVK